MLQKEETDFIHYLQLHLLKIEREDFANFVYKINKKTCKEDSTKCQPYEDIRYNRSTNI